MVPLTQSGLDADLKHVIKNLIKQPHPSYFATAFIENGYNELEAVLSATEYELASMTFTFKDEHGDEFPDCQLNKGMLGTIRMVRKFQYFQQHVEDDPIKDWTKVTYDQYRTFAKEHAYVTPDPAMMTA